MFGGVSRSIVTLVTVTACLAIPAGAGATTYCVAQTGGCPDDESAQGSLQAALTAAAADLPGPNTVRLGPGTYTAPGPGFDYSTPGAPAVAIRGAGQGLTTLQSSSGAPFILRLGVAGSAVFGLSIVLQAPSAAGLVLNASNTVAQFVTVTGTGGLGSADGVQLNGSATFTDGTVAMPESSDAAIKQVTGATGTVTRSHLSGAVGLATAEGGSTALAAHGVEIHASQHAAVAADTATMSIDSSLMVVHGSSPTALLSTNAELTVASATIVGSDGGGSSGVGGSISASDHSSASLTFTNSILRGFNHSFDRAVSGPGTAANLTAQYDDLHVTNSGSGSVPGLVTISHNIDTDPQFVDASSGDYHLFARSEAIDAGGPCDTICQAGFDLDGLIPPIDGDGDGTATRDMGAYEYGHRVPAASSSTIPSTTVRSPAPFDGRGSSDPDDGDRLTYAWSFDDGASANSAVTTHAFSTPGVHRATLTVTDSSGLTGTSYVEIRIVDAPAAPPPSHHHTKPKITNLMLAPPTFAVSARATAVSARSSLSRRRSGTSKGQSGDSRGSSIRFTLSETSTVTIAVERILTGHRSHGHCLSSARRGRACTVFESAGTLRRTAVRGGRVTIAFSGRIGQRPLAPGRYRVTVIATNTVRDISSPVSAPFTIVGR